MLHPDPDPHVFGPPGSGSTSQRYGSGSGSCSGSGSFYHHAIIVKKNLDSYYFVTLFDFLSLKNDVNVASKINKHKKLCNKMCFLLSSWSSLTKIGGSWSGSGSISQRHRSEDQDPDPPLMSWIRNRLAILTRIGHIITINVPLFKKLWDIIFFLWDNNFMSHFEGHFEGAKTLLTP